MPRTFSELADLLYPSMYLCTFPEMTIITIAASGSLFWMLAINLYVCKTTLR